MSQEVRDLMKHLWPMFQVYWYLAYVIEFHDGLESLGFLIFITFFLAAPKFCVCLLFPLGVLFFSSYGVFRNFKFKSWQSENLMQKDTEQDKDFH